MAAVRGGTVRRVLKRPAAADAAKLRAQLTGAERILLALDFDGTLAPIVERPEDAAIPAETAAVLRRLIAEPRVTVAVLSGRSMGELSSRIPPECIRAANHGLEIEGRGMRFVHEQAREMEAATDSFCWEAEGMLAGVPGIRVERKGLTATVHYRQAQAELAEWVEATVHLALRPYAARLRARPARMAWEILPRVEWNKGKALEWIMRHLGEPEPMVVCAGDDVTDEDMFAAVPGGISIRVGERKQTAARYWVEDPAGLAGLLEEVMGAHRFAPGHAGSKAGMAS